MSARELRFTLHPPVELWLKPEPPPGAESALIGWVMDTPPIDDGVPHDVALAITRALTSKYALTFLDPGKGKSAQWESHGSYSVRFLKPTGFLRLNPSAGYALTSTFDPETAVQLFDTNESLWVQQSQIVLLSLRDTPPPNITFQHLHDLLRSRQLDYNRLQSEDLCLGIVAPGPDGDFVQVILWESGAMSVLRERLRAESERSGLVFSEVTSSEFKQTRWFLQEVRQ
jgi:hypothetical protein